jgi:hypothetical protein
MKQFTAIEKLDTGILYTFELASSVSVLLLAFGLIASMANVHTKGAILTDNLIMQRIWAVTQCVGIDSKTTRQKTARLKLIPKISSRPVHHNKPCFMLDIWREGFP